MENPIKTLTVSNPEAFQFPNTSKKKSSSSNSSKIKLQRRNNVTMRNAANDDNRFLKQVVNAQKRQRPPPPPTTPSSPNPAHSTAEQHQITMSPPNVVSAVKSDAAVSTSTSSTTSSSFSAFQDSVNFLRLKQQQQQQPHESQQQTKLQQQQQLQQPQQQPAQNILEEDKPRPISPFVHTSSLQPLTPGILKTKTLSQFQQEKQLNPLLPPPAPTVLQKKIIRRNFTVGKSTKTNEVNVLLKNRTMRHDINSKLTQQKQIPILELKKRLVKADLLSKGSTCPANLIRLLNDAVFCMNEEISETTPPKTLD